MFGSWKLYISIALMVGIGFSAWWAIRTWRDDIRKAVFEELFADLVQEKNNDLQKKLISLQTDFDNQKKLFEQEKQNAIEARKVTDEIYRRTRNMTDGKPSPLLRETMTIIYDRQKDKQ